MQTTSIRPAHRPAAHRARRRWRCMLVTWVCVGVGLAALASGCGDGDGSEPDMPSVVGPLPDGPDDARAYSERFLSRNPRAQLPPDLLAVVELEPTGGDAGDTCGAEDGVDCLPYVFDDETLLTLSIDGSAPEIDQLVLRDSSGSVVLSVNAGDEPASTVVAPGVYALRLEHAFAGDPAAETSTIFLRPEESANDDAEAVPSPDVAAEQSSSQAATPPRSMSLTAGRDCVRCNFARADLTDQHFDGANLTAANFTEAKFLRTTLRGATLIGGTMTDLYPRTGDVYADGGNLTDHFDADFSGAKASGVRFSFFIERLGNFQQALPFFAIFRGATLDDTLWETNNPSDPPTQLRPDFSNASLQRAHFSFMVLTTPAKCADASRARADACSFRGADLTGAVFDDYFWNMNNTVEPTFRTVGNNLAHCSFGVEPTSGRKTTMKQVDLRPTESRRADMSSADLSGADLSGAMLDLVELDDQIAGCPRQPSTLAGADLSGATLTGAALNGANLSGAKLPGAKVAGVRWRGADLTDAVLTGMVPATFNDLDLTGANLTGVDFAGFDLARSDFSKAILSVPPRLTGATLSDGTRGVNLAGHKFPARYALFKGADLSGVDLSRTELFEADFEGATLNRLKAVGANLNFANLRGAKLRGAELGVQPGSEAAAASLRGAFMTDIDLTDADLRSVNLAGAHLYGDTQRTLLVRTRLDSANLSKAICSGAHFSGTLNNAVFDGAQLVNSVFNGATLTNTKLDDAYLQGADFSSALGVTGAVLNNSAISAAPGTWSFTEQDGTPFTIRYEATKLGQLATNPTVRCPNGSLGPCCPSNDLAACLTAKLKPVDRGPFPPVPECVPRAPRFDNCLTPTPTRTPRPVPTPR